MAEANDFLLSRINSNAIRTPNKLALTFLGSGSNGGSIQRQLTYNELIQVMDSVATDLLASGLKRGDMAVLVYLPSLDFMISFLACLKVGIIAVPVFPPQPSKKDSVFMFSRIVSSCGAKYALTSSSYNHIKTLNGVKETFTRFNKRAASTSSWPDQLKWIVTNTNLNNTKKAKNVPLWSSSPSDLAFLQYTSGSTSEPKGVMITHGNLAHNLTIITSDLKALHDTVVVSWLPQYHDMGLIGSYLGLLYCGGSGYYLSPLTFLQRPIIWMEAVSTYQATHLQAPNFSFKLTARKFDPSAYNTQTLNLSSVRHIINAAEPVDALSIDTFRSTFRPFGLKPEVLFPTYGLAEHTVFVCSGGTQRLDVSKHDLEIKGLVTLMANSNNNETTETTTMIGCGYPKRQGVDVRIVDHDTMVQLGEDTVGEIWVRSPSKAAGYYKKDEENKLKFRATISSGKVDEETLDDDNEEDPSFGYHRTGDLGFLHKEELFICGRLKDLIIVGGRNHYPQDIEATAEASCEELRPGCSAAFSVNPIGDGHDEEVALVAELRDIPASKDVDTVCVPLVETIRAAISKDHSIKLSYIVLVQTRSIPKTTSGKIARAWCRKGFLGKTLKEVYRHSYTDNNNNNNDGTVTKRVVPLEMESQNNNNHNQNTTNDSRKRRNETANTIRNLDTTTLRNRLINDIGQMASIPIESIDQDASLTSILDSVNLSQFHGMLQTVYFTNVSDGYLFRESTTVSKLAEVVKLGNAPDDNDDDEEGGGSSPSSNNTSSPGKAGGIAGALGCPPGIVCVIM